MSKKNNQIVNWLKALLIYGLLIYAASRTLDFVQGTMPPDRQYWGYLYLLATGAGAVIWQRIYLNKAQGSRQRAVSFAMAIIDLVAELLLVYADTQTVSAKNGMMTMTTQDTSMFIMASVGIIGLNILAGFMFDLWDPKADEEQQTQDMIDETTEAVRTKLMTPAKKAEMLQTYGPQLEAAFMARVAQQIAAGIGEYAPPEQITPTSIRSMPALPLQTAVKPDEADRSFFSGLRWPWDEKNQRTEQAPAAAPAPKVNSLTCMECGAPSGDLMFCSPAHELAWSEREALKVQNRLAALRAADLKEAASVPGAPFQGSMVDIQAPNR